MRVRRTLPPTAVHIPWKNFVHGLAALVLRQRYLKKFENELKTYFGVRHVFLVSSGKAGLYITLKALHGLSSRKMRVLIPAYTCFSVPSAIVKSGLTVSLCDINPTTLDFDYNSFEKALTEDTLCVIPNHLFGIPSDIQRVKALCRSREVFVLEDAAQSMGEWYDGSLLGTVGDVGVFSLGRGKNLSCGAGGIVVTNSDRIAHAIAEHYATLPSSGFVGNVTELLKAFLLRLFIHPSIYWFPSGLRFLKLGETFFYKDFPVRQLPAIGAALLSGWQQQLEELNRVRTRNTDYFCNRLGLTTPRKDSLPYLRFPIVTQDRELTRKIYDLSAGLGLGISKMYPTGIHEIEELKSQFVGMSFPSAHFVAERLLAIPTHHLLNDDDKTAICELLNESGSLQSLAAVGPTSTPDVTAPPSWPTPRTLHKSRT